MPRMDGFEATRIIRKQEERSATKGCQIVGLTAHATLDDREACLRAGMNTHVAKPIKLAKLKELISGHGNFEK